MSKDLGGAGIKLEDMRSLKKTELWLLFDDRGILEDCLLSD